MTQEQLGFESDLRRTFISVLELGQQQPSLSTVFKLAAALRISASELISQVERDLPSDIDPIERHCTNGQ